MVIMVGMGLGLLFEQYPLLHKGIKVLGTLYLIYLSWLIATAPVSSMDVNEGKPLSFTNAVLFQWVNPKAWVMITGAVAAYTTTGDNLHIQVLVITAAFLIVAFPCVSTWLIFGVTLRKYLANQTIHRMFNVLMALLLLASVLPVILELVSNPRQLSH